MAWAFDAAGFEPVDVHMSELLAGARDLSDFQGLVACGGFSYGDVLGAGQGWARSVLFHEAVRQQFADFFADDSRFALGVCNGCQMLAQLGEIMPGDIGGGAWPRFLPNLSGRFESRLAMVRVEQDSSPWLAGMAGAELPIVVAHGEGRVERLPEQGGLRIALRYIDDAGQGTAEYPFNPNGSPEGVTGLHTADGRVLAMMPHPERLFRSVQHSWAPAQWGESGPWLKLFLNAREWVG